jgi:hypothetical protein
VKQSNRDGEDNVGVDILVLKYKSPEVESECVRRIINGTDHPYVLHLIDNRNGLKNMAVLWNYWVMHTPLPYKVIMDSDALVAVGWLSAMMETLERQNAGVVVPATNLCGFSPQMKQYSEERPLEGASGFCFLFGLETYKEVGPFDEQFEFYGQDTEWFARVRKAKRKIVLQPKAYVDHLGSYSARADVGFDAMKDRREAQGKLEG